ncbi:MAG: nicotinate (nicotinamide) nucleotide adenylyltransferase [Desulfobacteraceae bacterium 4572_89]|nr:MAG: nicotinate (nicotinamide) nucleotide adenylyltransferase [Desulfobacteraceae bacterium 4572_89]
MNTGLFGGTFNPLHNGHIGIIKYVKQAYQLQKVFLFPSATPPHKPNSNLAPARDRLEMVTGSVKDLDGVYASDIELKRKGPSFTIDTINAFKKNHGLNLNFFLLMGSDAFFDITTWKSRELIFKAVPIIVMLRGKMREIKTIASFIDEHVSKGYSLDAGQNKFTHGQMQPIHICNVPKIDISSTMIRTRVKENRSITGLVPINVENIISKKDLYK